MGSLDTCDTTFDFSRLHARLHGNVRNEFSCHICPIEEKERAILDEFFGILIERNRRNRSEIKGRKNH